MLVLGANVATFAIATPYRYGAWLDPSAALSVGGLTLNFGMGLQYSLLHVGKVCFVAAIVPAWRKSAWAGALLCSVCVPLVILSPWNAVALLALHRSERVTEVRAVIERADRLRAELASIGARLTLVGWKPLAAAEAEIAVERHDWRWDATAGCTEVAGGGERQFCARLARLEARAGQRSRPSASAPSCGIALDQTAINAEGEDGTYDRVGKTRSARRVAPQATTLLITVMT